MQSTVSPARAVHTSALLLLSTATSPASLLRSSYLPTPMPEPTYPAPCPPLSECQERIEPSLAYTSTVTCAHEPTRLHSCSKFITPGCYYGNTSKYVIRSEKISDFVIIQFVQYRPKALPRSQSRDFAIGMPRCSTVS